MTDTKKAVEFSWTDAVIAQAVELYQAADVETRNTKPELGKIAIVIGAKSAQSVMSKLVTEGVYIKSESKGTAGGNSVTQKCQIVSAVEIMLSLKKGSLATLGKANKQELQALADALTKISEKQDADKKADDKK